MYRIAVSVVGLSDGTSPLMGGTEERGCLWGPAARSELEDSLWLELELVAGAPLGVVRVTGPRDAAVLIVRPSLNGEVRGPTSHTSPHSSTGEVCPVTDAMLADPPTHGELCLLTDVSTCGPGLHSPTHTDNEQDIPALKTVWGDWVAAQGPWHVFGGLTYDPAKVALRLGRSDQPLAPDTVHKDARRWLGRCNKVLGNRLEAAVVALEHHKSGWPHLHPLIRLSGGLQGGEFAQLGGLWYGPNGYAKLEEPRSQGDVAGYASKYLVKELERGDVTIWPLRGAWPAHQPSVGVT